MGEVSVDPEDIIAAVRTRPVLWDRKHDTESVERTKNKYAAAWQQVFQQLVPEYDSLSADVKDAQGKLIMKKWRNIKDQYVKSTKRSNLRGMSGRKHKKYIYHHLLTFIEVNSHEEPSSECKELKKEPDYYYTLEDDQNTSNDFDVTEEDMEYLPGTQQFPHTLLTDSANARESAGEKAAANCPSEADCGQPENRHVWFFKSIVPSLADFDDDETLHFQSSVINTILNIKKSRKPPS